MLHRRVSLVVAAALIAGLLGVPSHALADGRRSGADPGGAPDDGNTGRRGVNVPPTVRITCPEPSALAAIQTLPSIQILWEGSDPDGFTGRPVEYKYILLGPSSEFPPALAMANPDSLRRYYAGHPLGPWAGWDSTGADTTRVQFTNLIPSQQYVFALIAFDDAGAYSPVFSFNSNMLRLDVTFVGFTGPRITLLGPDLEYQYPSGGYCPCASAEVPTDVAAGQPVTFEWFADPDGVCGGASIRWYRWSLDSEDLTDNTPRIDENDLQHWSAPSLTTTSATLGPFAIGEVHHLYVEAEDNAGLRSLGIIRFTVVADDNQAPGCGAAAAEPRQLWPPNHKFVPVSVTGVTDPDGDPVAVTVTRVTQDEPLDGADAIIDPDGRVKLRAERSGQGNGRVYTIWFTASDGQGGSCEGSVQVCVPHDQGHPACADDGQVFDSLEPCAKDLRHRGVEEGLATATLAPMARTGNTTTLRYSLPAAGRVLISVFDVAGRHVATLENDVQSAGDHEVTWDTSSLTHGMYFCRLRAGPATVTRSVLISR